jgi:hypothetical protein
MALFAVAEEVIHHVGDARCPACAVDFPEPCPCGGLVHAEAGEVAAAEAGAAEPTFASRCDTCGRSLEDLAERR